MQLQEKKKTTFIKRLPFFREVSSALFFNLVALPIQNKDTVYACIQSLKYILNAEVPSKNYALLTGIEDFGMMEYLDQILKWLE